MRNIWKIINGDAHRIFSSVVVLVILMGLCVVPCLYSWFNVFSNWDPYGQSATSRIRVAVANRDRGTDLLGVELKVGEQLLEGLKANDQIGWVFCESQDEALAHVYSGDCYAAVIVPDTFSKDIVSFMTLKFEHPKLQYYENEKKNAIAPKITGKAKTAVQEQVNTTFLQTLANTAAEIVSALNANGIDAETTLTGLSEKLVDLSMELEKADDMLDSLIGVANATSTLLLASSRLTYSMSETVFLTADASADIGEKVTEATDEQQAGIEGISKALQTVSGNLSDFLNRLSDATATPEDFQMFLFGGVTDAQQSLKDMQQSTSELADRMQELGLNALSEEMRNLSDRIGDLNQDLTDAAAGLDLERLEGLRKTVNTVSGALGSMTEDFAAASALLGQRLIEALERIEAAAGNITETLNAFGIGLYGVSAKLNSMAGSMVNVESRILEAKADLDEARKKLLELADFLGGLAQSQFLKEAMEVLSSGGDLLDSHIASPLKVSEEVLYPAEPYGSQMSPFYTVLAQYVGALFCACLLKTGVPEKYRPRRMNMLQHYIGRYVLFLCCGLLQAVITVAGVLLYVRIECAHPWYFLLAGLATSFCFVTLNYVLSFTLGSAGLGASVIIMVVQVAGSGGTYPVEVLPKIFKILYPYMPFKFAMDAMREAVSGFYGSYYADNVRMLMLIALGCLIAGVVIYYPGKLLNDTLEKSKKATGVMI